MSLASATSSFFTMWPLMSRPRMFCAWVNASSGVAAYFTPPALPRPPAFTWALTMTGRPISSAMALAPSAVSVTRPGVVGTLCFANSSFAWYSKRSIDSLSLCVDVEGLCPTGQGELYPHELAGSAPPTAHVVDLTAGQHVIQVTIPRWNTSSGCGQHWDLVNVPLVQITFRSRLEGHCRLARHRLSPAPDGVSTNDPTDGNPYAAVNYDAAITDIIPFNEFGDLADLEFRENC